jgi:hypothetical protein
MSYPIDGNFFSSGIHGADYAVVALPDAVYAEARFEFDAILGEGVF